MERCRILNIFLYCFPFACFVVFSAAEGAYSQIRVGVVAGLSGESAAYGKAFQDGIALAQFAFPDSPATFIYEDDQFIPRLSVQAARKLISVDKVQVLIVGDTNTAKAVAAAVPDDIPIYVWASEQLSFLRPNIVRAWPREEKELLLTARAVVQDSDSSLALLASSHEYTLAWARGMKEQLGARVRYYEEFSTDLNDFRSLLVKLRGLKVQRLGLCLNNPKNGQIAREAADLRMAFKLFGCNFLQASSDQRVARGALAGAWYMDTAVSPEFSTAYRKRTGTTDYMTAAAVIHDIAAVILRASARKLDVPDLALLNPIAGANGVFNIRTDAGVYFDFDFVKVVIDK